MDILFRILGNVQRVKMVQYYTMGLLIDFGIYQPLYFQYFFQRRCFQTDYVTFLNEMAFHIVLSRNNIFPFIGFSIIQCICKICLVKNGLEFTFPHPYSPRIDRESKIQRQSIFQFCFQIRFHIFIVQDGISIWIVQ